MSFDPDAFLAGPAPKPAAPSGAFDPDAFLKAPAAPAPEAPPAEPPSLLEAGVRGAAQGVTFGFGDEISGALESAFTDKTYAQARDEARAANKAAREAHPIGYGLGQIVGGAAVPIPGLGLAGAGVGLGARIAANAARGALAGGLTAAGESEADLTKAGGAEQMVRETAKGGLLGGALGGIIGTAAEKYVQGAEGRANEQLVTDVTGGRATNAGKRVWADEEDVIRAARKFGIDKVAKDVDKGAAAADSAMERVGPMVASVTKAADEKAPGIALEDFTGALGKLEAKYRGNAATVDKADAIAKQIETIKKTYGGTAEAPLAFVPVDKVRQYGSAIGTEGFAGSGLQPGATATLQREIWAATKDIVNAHVEKVMGPKIGSKFAELNQEYSALKNIAGAFRDRSSIPPPNRAAGGLRNAAENVGKVASIGMSIASGNPLPAIATYAGIPLAKAGDRAATQALARLAASARAGSAPAALIQAALAAGVPRGTIEATISAVRPGAQEAQP